jgi:hypothetical protein
MSSLHRSASADEKADLSSVIKKMDEALNIGHYRQRRRVYCYEKLEPRSMERPHPATADVVRTS